MNRAKLLLTAMIPLRIEWFAQATLNTLQDDDFLDLVQESGGRVIFVGLESLSEANLYQVNKRWNKPALMQETVARLHRHGIAMLGAFIIGLPDDDLGVVDRIVRFVQEAKIPLVQIAILTPLPGTPVARELASSMFDRDYRHRDGSRMTFFHPKVFPPIAFERMLQSAYARIYSKKAVNERFNGLSGQHVKLAKRAASIYRLLTSQWRKKLTFSGLKLKL